MRRLLVVGVAVALVLGVVVVEAVPTAAAPAAPVGSEKMFESQIHDPRDIAAGPDGALWFTNFGGDSVGRISTSGAISTFKDQNVRTPRGITGGPDGNVWFTSEGGVSRITPSGVITTWGTPGGNAPDDITTGPDGNLWFVNPGNDYVGRITPDGDITTFTSSAVDSPTAIVAAPDGTMWFANEGSFVTVGQPCPPCHPVDPHWEGSSIARITVAGVISSVTGAAGPSGIAAGPDGSIWYTNHPVDLSTGNQKSQIVRIPQSGPVSQFAVSDVGAGITVGPDGNVWYTGRGFGLYRITPAGVVTQMNALDVAPYAIVTGPDGNLWFDGNSSIGRITPAGVATRFRGSAVTAGRTIVGPDGAIWFTNGDSIGRIGPSGTVSNFRNPTTDFQGARAITVGADGKVWFSYENGVGRVTPAGVVTLFPNDGLDLWTMATAANGTIWASFGTGGDIGRVNPDGTVTHFSQPGVNPSLNDLTLGPDGNIWFVNGDTVNSIGRINPNGTVKLFTAATTSTLTLGPDGNLWFSNWTSSGASISRMTRNGAVTTFTDPGITSPQQLSAGADGTMWFTNFTDKTIGRISLTGAVETFPVDAYPLPGGVAGPDGNMWFALDGGFGDAAIGRVTPDGAVTTFPLTGFFPLGNFGPPLLAPADGGIWYTGDSGVIGRFQAMPADLVSFTAHYSAPRCFQLTKLAGGFNLDTPAPVLRFGVELFARSVDAGTPPVVTPPANVGPCAITVTWPTEQVPRLAATANALGVTPTQLNNLGGELVVAVVIFLGSHGAS